MDSMIEAMRAMGIYTEEQIQESIKAMQMLQGAGALEESPMAQTILDMQEETEE